MILNAVIIVVVAAAAESFPALLERKKEIEFAYAYYNSMDKLELNQWAFM